MSDRRNTVFLQEMGVGPQWRLRNRPASAEADADAYSGVEIDAPEAFASGADAAAMHVSAASAAHMPAPAVPMPPGAAPVAPQQVPAAPPRASASAPSAPQTPPAAAATATRAATSAPGRADDADQAAPDVPATPTRVPGTPSIASTGEDMSWFDDAPTPEFKPQRKKVAAPEQLAAAQPARPPAAAQAMPPARQPMPQRAANAPPPAMADDMPALDDIPMDEPPSWFDDEQPAAAAPSRSPTPCSATDEEIAQMDWPALQAAVSSCTRCGRCETRKQAVPGRGDEQATWIALDTAPGQAEDTEGYQFAGDTGYLLDNMLKAVGQGTETGAYLTSLVKCHAPHAPSAEELQACRPYLQRELELTQAKVIVAFGHTTGKGLLGSAARGRIMLHGSVPVIATYHPADLLKKPEEKAKAWQDLCLAKAAHAGRR